MSSLSDHKEVQLELDTEVRLAPLAKLLANKSYLIKDKYVFHI